MLSLFRTNQLLANLLLIVYVAILFAHTFVVDTSIPHSQEGIISYLLYQYLPFGSTLGIVLTIFILFIQAFIINYIAVEHKIQSEVNLFPGLFYLLVAGSMPQFTSMSPLHFANLFYLLALLNLYTVYNNPKSASPIYNIGIWLGLASLFYSSYLLLILFAFMGLQILRAFSLKERFMVIFGMLTPYVLLGVYLFWNDRLDFFIDYQFIKNLGFTDFSIIRNWQSINFEPLIFMAFFVIAGIFSYNIQIARKTREIQKKVNILYWMLFLSIPTLFFQKGMAYDHLLILSIPLGILISGIFNKISKSWAELIHLLFLAIVLFLHFRPVIF
ncbi:MAG: DUF6427 family protein [Bacteroidota bacterium]